MLTKQKRFFNFLNLFDKLLISCYYDIRKYCSIMSTTIYIMYPIMGITKIKNTCQHRYFLFFYVYFIYRILFNHEYNILFSNYGAKKNKSKAKFVCFTFILSDFSKTLRYIGYGLHYQRA